MTYRIKVPPKTAPIDEAHLLTGLERATRVLQRYRLAVFVGLLLLLLSVAIVVAVVWTDRRYAEAAAQLDLRATRLYLDRPVDQPAKADENLKQAITLYRQLIDQYPRSPSAPLALYHLGNALFQANDLSGAIDAYKKFVLTYGSNKTLVGLVYQRLGYAYLVKGDTDQAIKAFEAALQVPGGLNKDQVLFELGKLEEAQSRPEGALARYQDLMKGYPNSPFSGEAAVRIKALEAKKGSPGSATEAEHAAPSGTKQEQADKPAENAGGSAQR